MTRALIAELAPFKGQEIKDCIDLIETTAHAAGFSVNVIDPQFNSGSIDNDPKRLNVRVDQNSVITSFTIG
jgi:hypothetical protein